MEKIKIIGVRFRTAGKIYFFNPGDLTIRRGDHVIVETARGIEYGTVVGDPREVEKESIVQPLKPVIRIATDKDDQQEAENKKKEREAFLVCHEKIRKHGLEMKLIDAEYTFDNNKVLFYFTANGRIDFRELVKDLAAVFKTRIELRQIGVRDETKILGGLGICGRPLCCHSYLSEFVPVSIKMAKEQNLSLNPTKISGVCGRLMCCLKNEEETYEELNRQMPHVGDYVTTEDGIKGEVHSVNVLRQLVRVLIIKDDEKVIQEFKVDQLSFKRKNRSQKMEIQDDVELKHLESLEQMDHQERAEQQEKPARSEKQEKNRQHRFEHGKNRENKSAGKSHHPEKGHGGKPEKNRKQDRQDRHDRQEYQERRTKGEKPCRQEHRNRESKPGRNRREGKQTRDEG